jgi:hypothetical protein
VCPGGYHQAAGLVALALMRYSLVHIPSSSSCCSRRRSWCNKRGVQSHLGSPCQRAHPSLPSATRGQVRRWPMGRLGTPGRGITRAIVR